MSKPEAGKLMKDALRVRISCFDAATALSAADCTASVVRLHEHLVVHRVAIVVHCCRQLRALCVCVSQAIEAEQS